MLELTVTDLAQIDSEPRVLDLVVAQRLGFARARVVRELIVRNKAELESYGLIAVRYGDYRNHKNIEYWLNETQALLVCVLSRTENAVEARRALIAVFAMWRHGQLVPSQRPTRLPRAQRRAINAEAWARTKGEAGEVFRRHQGQLLEEARCRLAAGQPTETLLGNNVGPQSAE